MLIFISYFFYFLDNKIKRMNNFNILNILFIVFLITKYEVISIKITDNFMLCKQNMLRPPINLEKICTADKNRDYKFQYETTALNKWFDNLPKKQQSEDPKTPKVNLITGEAKQI